MTPPHELDATTIRELHRLAQELDMNVDNLIATALRERQKLRDAEQASIAPANETRASGLGRELRARPAAANGMPRVLPALTEDEWRVIDETGLWRFRSARYAARQALDAILAFALGTPLDYTANSLQSRIERESLRHHGRRIRALHDATIGKLSSERSEQLMALVNYCEARSRRYAAAKSRDA